MRSPSVLNRTLVPRCSRICFVVRLIIPCRLPDWANSTFPVPVILKRFLAPDLVFNLGIWLSFCGPRAADRGQPVMLGFERADGALRRRHGSPLAGQRGGRVYGREPAKWQPLIGCATTIEMAGTSPAMTNQCERDRL